MRLIEDLLLKEIDSAIFDNDASVRGCSAHLQRLLGALAVAGSHGSQAVLSNVIEYQEFGHTSQKLPPCLKVSIESTHHVKDPDERLFDTIYSLATQFPGASGLTQVAEAAMLAMGSLGRSSQIVLGTEGDVHPLSFKASVLLQHQYEQAFGADLTGSQSHHRLKTKMAKAFEKATDGMRDHVMASMRSLTRYVTCFGLSMHVYVEKILCGGIFYTSLASKLVDCVSCRIQRAISRRIETLRFTRAAALGKRVT